MTSQAASSLVELDSVYWTRQYPRKLDLLSEYANGAEGFILDGDAVISNALRDIDRLHFQSLHLVWCLEQLIKLFVERDCAFTLVFFNDNIHHTVQTGENDDITSTRKLARTLLKKLAAGLVLEVLEFKNINDVEWFDYYERKHPMFIVSDDGGLVSSLGGYQSDRILVQRNFLFSAMNQGVAVVLLSQADFKDDKIITYIYDRARFVRKHPLPAQIIETSKSSLALLNDLALAASSRLLSSTSTTAPATNQTNDIISSAANRFLSASSVTEVDKALLFIYIAHLPLLRSLSLEHRAQSLRSMSSQLSEHLKSTFFPKFYAALEASVALVDDLFELDLDGRIFAILLVEVVAGSSSLVEIVGPDMYEETVALWTALSSQSAVPDTAVITTQFPHDPTALIPPPVSAPISATLLPFSDPSFDSHLSLVHVATSTSSTLGTTIQHQLPPTTVFDDTSKWHYAKPLLLTHLGSPPPPKVPLLGWQIRKKAKAEGRFMAQMQKNASSLTGALGGALKQTSIPVVGNRAKAKSGTEKVVQNHERKKGGEKVKVLNSKEKLLAANAAKSLVEDAALNTTWWLSKLNLSAPLAIPAQIALLSGYFANKRAQDPWLGTEMMLKRLDLELRLWIADERREATTVRDTYVTYLARTTVGLMRKSMAGEIKINERQGKALGSILEAVGLSCLTPVGITYGISANLTASKKSKDKDALKKDAKKDKDGGKKDGKKEKEEEKEEKVKLTFSFVTILKSGKIVHEWMKIVEDPIEFQLRCMGEYMVRSLDSKPDSRVNFEPDAWQIDVLDKIDNDESMLIVAPTSSGKTFISFAAMEKVLRESDNGIVIYVAPTKALVNQVAAEVFARFRKDVPGRQMWAIHTLDYRINNPQNCQILVTVPHILSTMLLNPALSAAWTPRIRRVILDEIHSISMEEGGAIWEQVLLMNPAPLIGLSATVGAPDRFSAWLESIEKTRGRKYSLIQHHYRYNALRKSAYAPSLPFKRLGPLNEHVASNNSFPHVHPLAALALGDSHLPDDLALEPFDCLSLVKAMREVNDVAFDPALVPTTYFAKTPSIRIADVIPYEEALKECLLSWMKESEAADSDYRQAINILEAPLKTALAVPEKVIEEGDADFFFSLFTPMLADLNALNQLPAIIFNFDRKSCEKTCRRILADLEAGEELWRSKSPAYKARVAKAAEDERLAKTRAKANENASRQKKDEDNDGMAARDDTTNPFNPDDPSEEFCLLGKGISRVEFDKEINSLGWMNLPGYLIAALKRGVGVHHAGLARRYRVLVENFFRRGILKVVISTETLALGVNAPAKTVIFGGDSHLLNALNFRQCSGRAGRRGFDTLGRAVFVGISIDRIQRLLLSKLPKLGGTFPLTTTLVLRLNSLLHGSNRAPLAVESIDQLLNLPQLSVGNKMAREQSLHFLRFSLEYCRRAGLLDETGRPLTIFGIAQALYNFEPANFALIALIRSGELHKVTDSFDTDPLKTVNKLIIILAHLFARQPRPAQSIESLESITKTSPSIVVLPPLPAKIAQVLKAHNQAIVNIFSSFTQEFSQQNAASLGPDITLPISNRSISPSATTTSPLSTRLTQTALSYDARSPFVAQSGKTDVFSTVSELTTTARNGITLTKHALPALELFGEDGGQVLDSYVVDFFRHGRQELLMSDNGIRKSDLWFFLGDFASALSSLKTSLEVILERSTEDHEEDNDSDDGQDGGPMDGEEGEGSKVEDEIARPVGVNDSDWKLYRAVSALKREFSERYQLIFA